MVPSYLGFRGPPISDNRCHSNRHLFATSPTCVLGVNLGVMKAGFWDILYWIGVNTKFSLLWTTMSAPELLFVLYTSRDTLNQDFSPYILQVHESRWSVLFGDLKILIICWLVANFENTENFVFQLLTTTTDCQNLGNNMNCLRSWKFYVKLSKSTWYSASNLRTDQIQIFYIFKKIKKISVCCNRWMLF